MARRALTLLVGAAAAGAALVAVRRRGAGTPSEKNGGRERTEKLRREIEASRARLRESIRSRDG